MVKDHKDGGWVREEASKRKKSIIQEIHGLNTTIAIYQEKLLALRKEDRNVASDINSLASKIYDMREECKELKFKLIAIVNTISND